MKYIGDEGKPVVHTPPLDLTTATQLDLPAAWQVALTGPETIPDQVLALWEPLARILPRTRKAYAAHCVALVVVETRQHPLSLLYCFDLGTEWTAQRGFRPTESLPEVADRFPVDLKPLYALHDGLVNISSGEDGPLPIERWNAIPDQQGGQLIEVLSEGGRGLGFDLSIDPVRTYWLDADSQKDPVREIPDAWAYMDGFMASWLERQE